MKRNNKKKKSFLTKKSSIFFVLIFITTLFLGIGYAQISSVDLTISGTATTTVTKDVVITSIEYVSGNLVDQNNQEIEDTYLTLMTSKIEVGNDLTSSITYKIKVKNNGDSIATYDKTVFSSDLGYDNPDIEFDISGINYGDVLQSKEEKEFFITFRYKDSLTNVSNNVLNSILNFRFLSEKLYYHSDQLVFDGTNYIDTGVKLFSEENIHKNFEISFDITNIDGTQTSQATIINSMQEISPYPGFVFRFQTNGTHLEFNSPKIANKAGINASTTNKIIIKRVNDIYYVQVNENTPERIGTYSGSTFDETTAIGASIDGNGDPWRFFKGTLSNVTIALSEPESYTIKFDANGGTGRMDEQNIRKDESVALNKNTFEKEGKMLGSWNTEPDGSGTSYRNSEQVSNIANPGETITLYAIWVDGFHYFVHFNANGGTGTMNNQELVYAVNQNLNTNLFVREGYIFDHWNTSADGTGTNFTQNQLVKNLSETENDIVDLYAIWYPLEYSYDGEYEFSGSNYINTGIYLFSSQTIDKDFDLSFEIVNRISSSGQATIMSAMDESGSPWPGIVYRIKSNIYDQVAANATSSNKLEKDYNRDNISKVLLKRRNGILYINFNDGEDEQLLDMSSLTKSFDIPLTFGCSLKASGNPQRYFTGTLKDMHVKLYE